MILTMLEGYLRHGNSSRPIRYSLIVYRLSELVFLSINTLCLGQKTPFTADDRINYTYFVPTGRGCFTAGHVLQISAPSGTVMPNHESYIMNQFKNRSIVVRFIEYEEINPRHSPAPEERNVYRK